MNTDISNIENMCMKYELHLPQSKYQNVAHEKKNMHKKNTQAC